MTESPRFHSSKQGESTTPCSLSGIPLEGFTPDQGLKTTRYKIGKPITRENFIPWFVYSFAISRGDPDVQYGFIRWSAAQAGLDFHSTFQNYIDSGAENCLSNEEKNLVQSAYDRIPVHHEADRQMIEEGSEPSSPVLILTVYAADFSDRSTHENSYVNKILEDFRSTEEFDLLSWEKFLEWSKSKFKKKDTLI